MSLKTWAAGEEVAAADLNSNFLEVDTPFFGDASDGTVTIYSNTTLTRDMYYDDLTIDNTFTLTTAGFKVFVKGTLTNNGTIDNSGSAGANASGITAGAGGAATPEGTLLGSEAGGAGGNGSAAGGGSAGSAGTAYEPVIGPAGAAGGGGGSSDNGGSPGGGGGAAGAKTAAVTSLLDIWSAGLLQQVVSGIIKPNTSQYWVRWWRRWSIFNWCN